MDPRLENYWIRIRIRINSIRIRNPTYRFRDPKHYLDLFLSLMHVWRIAEDLVSCEVLFGCWERVYVRLSVYNF
jgi:hypothetical protein